LALVTKEIDDFAKVRFFVPSYIWDFHLIVNWNTSINGVESVVNEVVMRFSVGSWLTFFTTHEVRCFDLWN
jgi:hypothetical protein